MHSNDFPPARNWKWSANWSVDFKWLRISSSELVSTEFHFPATGELAFYRQNQQICMKQKKAPMTTEFEPILPEQIARSQIGSVRRTGCRVENPRQIGSTLDHPMCSSTSSKRITTLTNAETSSFTLCFFFLSGSIQSRPSIDWEKSKKKSKFYQQRIWA